MFGTHIRLAKLTGTITDNCVFFTFEMLQAWQLPGNANIWFPVTALAYGFDVYSLSKRAIYLNHFIITA